MSASVSANPSVARSVHAIIERPDVPHQKAQVERHLQYLRRLSYWGFVCLFVNTVYLSYRAKCALDARASLSLSDSVTAGVFLTLELSFALPSCLGYIGAVSCLKKLRMRPTLRLAGDEVPTVDVLITCCGESLDVILDTVRAACTLDYPSQRYRVILLDDGNSADLKHHIEILRKGQGNLFYTARGVDVTTHSKAANLNHGFSFAQRLKTGPSEYVAVLDVDMIPMPDFLRALLPHLLDDPSFAMATLPQNFYNMPDGDPLCQGLDTAYSVFFLKQDSSNSCFCTGSGWVLRRSAAEQIQGIPTDQLNEDLMTSLVLCAKGWKIAYVWEPLQWGLVPDSLAGQAKQAARWSKGYMSIAPALLGTRLANMSLGERLQPAFGILAFFGPAFALTCAMLFVPTVLILGRPFVTSETPQKLRNLLILSSLQLLVTWLNGFIIAVSVGFRAQVWPPYRHPFLAPFQSLAALMFLFPVTQNSTPSGSPLDGEPEREARASNSFVRRLKFLLDDLSSWFQIVVICSTLFGVTLCIRRALNMNIGYQHQLQRLFVGAAWPPAFVHWMMFIVECWKPINHVLFPPRIHSREALLNRDPKTKVAYPSDKAKDGQRIRPSQGFSFFILAYALFILACTWGMKFE
ncbi:MAG: hypothetical protein ASARMPREDX12_005071 [Alectoria sarmentosa]|nr:MAG: hypothetical protein ASARMPREDX12_005071 [Alectoria sarmentosa]